MINKHLVILFLALISQFVFLQAYEFPKPQGRFAVGTVAYHWRDIARKEPYESAEAKKRELVVQCWYPSKSERLSDDINSAYYLKEQYLKNTLPHLAKMARDCYGIPEFFINNVFKDVYVHAIPYAPIIEQQEKFPVIVFSHGLGSLNQAQTVFAENLASNGYVVFGINHSYDCLITIFPNGRVEQLNFRWDQNNQVEYLNKAIAVWAEDVSFVLDMLPVVNLQDQHHLLTGKLDLAKIGVFGHSLGGGTMTKVCSQDKRVLAGVNLDGPVFDGHMQNALNVPFMFLFAEGTLEKASKPFSLKEIKARNITLDEEALVRKAFRENAIEMLHRSRFNKNATYFLVLKNAGHYTFTDAPLVKYMSFFFQWADFFGFDIGSIEPLVALRITNAYLLSFFDTYVRGNKKDSLFEPYLFIHPEILNLDEIKKISSKKGE